MAASNTDKIRLSTPTFATTLTSPIVGSGDSSMALASVAGLPTGTGISLTIDATNASGQPTPAIKETVTGVVSGSDIVNLLRGQDSTTAQAHATGANVVMWITANLWNDFANAFLAQHTQAAHHTGITTDTMVASGNVTVNGTLIASGGTTLPTGDISTADIAANAATKGTTLLNNVAAASQSITATATFTDLTNSSTSFTSAVGGDLLFSGSLACFKTTAGGTVSARLVVNSLTYTYNFFFNELSTYRAIPINCLITGIAAGTVNTKFQLATSTNGVGIDGNGSFQLDVVELKR